MKKYLLSITFLLATISLYAQDRYYDEIFEDFTVETITYSDVSGFEMDIYQPVGDDETMRPVFVFAHGGSYVGGTKNNPTPEAICKSLAKRGYVTASIQYTFAESAISLMDSLYITDIVMKTVGDAKAAIRFFRKDAATDNVYKINPDKVYVGGNSAGAITMAHLAFIDQIELNNYGYLVEIVNENGGIEGNKGNDGYSSEVSAVVNFAGGLNKLSFISPDDPPIVSLHGTADGTVPYLCDDVFEGTLPFIDMIDICGSGAMKPVLDENEVYNDLWSFDGEDHTPWEYNNTLRTEVVEYAAQFLAPFAADDDLPSSINNIDKNNIITVYPNPAVTGWNIDLNETADIMLFDNLGRLILTKNTSTNTWIDALQLPTGMYQLLVNFEDGTSVIKRLIK